MVKVIKNDSALYTRTLMCKFSGCLFPSLVIGFMLLEDKYEKVKRKKYEFQHKENY